MIDLKKQDQMVRLRLLLPEKSRNTRVVDRLMNAWQKIDDYKIATRLDVGEGLVLDDAFLAQIRVSFSMAEGEYLAGAVRALKSFQDAQAQLRARPRCEVTMLDETDWDFAWLNERRLTVVFEPVPNDDGFFATIKEVLLPRQKNRLEFVSRLSDLDLGDRGSSLRGDIDDVLIVRRDELTKWQGSVVSISESSDAQELWGGAWSTHTTVSANFTLASVSFDFLRERLDAFSSEKSGAERMLLACGFVAPDGSVPRPRKVGRDQKIANPLRLTVEAGRMAFELAGIFADATGPGGGRLQSFARWMAIEQA